MNLINRVEKLEQASGVGNERGVCAWYGVGNVDIRLSNEAARPPQLCDECGRVRRVITINIVRGPNPHAALAASIGSLKFLNVQKF
jgi:hypothetical protein